MQAARLVAAIAIPVALQFVGVKLGHWADGGQLVHYLTMSIALGVGVYVFQLIEFSTAKIGRVLTAVYAAVCMAVLFWVTLLTVCSYGDCL